MPDLSQVSIEDLLNIEVTSAARKEQRVADVAAAVFVITSDDIRRSGMTTIPDLLRLAPGVDVAQLNSNKWGASVRGFNGLYANKLLVLIDGRSLYNRVFAGVFWDTEDMLLDDIDRIEVIRGPGAAIWGANAVNGVINIITKSAAETKGTLIRADGGRSGEQATVRYGGTLGAASYRVFSQWTGRAQHVTGSGTLANDGSHSTTTGFRADWAAQPGAFTLQGTFTAGQSHALWTNLDPQTAAREPFTRDPSDTQGGYVLGRWTRTRAGGASLQVQSFVDVASRQEPIGDYDRRVVDVDTQYHTPVGTRQDLVAGVGYRFIRESLAEHVGLALTPAEESSTLVTAFLHDEIALFGNRLAVTLGSQVQHDAVTGGGVQPTARAIWKALPHQRLWAATSFSLRTPSLYERGLLLTYPPVPSPAGLPLVVTMKGNPAQESERFIDAEAGYRLEIGAVASIDVTGFSGHYSRLRTTEALAPVVQFVPSPRIVAGAQFGNELNATTRGLELAGHWTPVPAWRFDAAYTGFLLTPELAATSQDPNAAREDGTAPAAQWHVRSTVSPVDRATLNVMVFRVGPLKRAQVDAYTRADVSAEWRFTGSVSATVIGQNLLSAAHRESAALGTFVFVTQVPRSASLRLRWTFR